MSIDMYEIKEFRGRGVIIKLNDIFQFDGDGPKVKVIGLDNSSVAMLTGVFPSRISLLTKDNFIIDMRKMSLIERDGNSVREFKDGGEYPFIDFDDSCPTHHVGIYCKLTHNLEIIDGDRSTEIDNCVWIGEELNIKWPNKDQA